MSKIPWHLIQDRHLRAHLVVGVAEQAEGPVVGDGLKAIHSLLTRLVAKQEPAGDYAATVVRDAGCPEVHFAFEDQADARQFAAAVKAEATVSYPGWASQRAFELDGAKLAKGQIDQSPLVCVRRGPWTPIIRDD